MFRISTHAPRTGSDLRVRRRHPLPGKFQPTLPARGATPGFAKRGTKRSISTHAPRTGSDQIPQTTLPAVRQFQPTLPARGATSTSGINSAGSIDFNPRSPHGERRGQNPFQHEANYFNPRSPHGERLPCGICGKQHMEISTHAPRTGSDARQRHCQAPASYFNPRSPHGERRDQYATTSYVDISTHVPRTGSDTARNQRTATGADFNPRSPHGERPKGTIQARMNTIISTHAPRTGSDKNVLHFVLSR